MSLFKRIDCRELAKRPAKFLTNSSESKLVIGDKTGDVYLMDLKTENLEQSQPQLLMGHMSMLTDMVPSHVQL